MAISEAGSKPASDKTAATVAGSFMFCCSTQIARNTASRYFSKRSSPLDASPTSPRMSVMVLMGKKGFITKGTP